MRTMYSTTALCTCLVAGLTTVAPTRVLAADADAVAIGEVIVTAQKRAENVQDVPQAVQVVSASQLQAQGVREFTDLTKLAPSLVVRPAEQPVNSSVSLRGIGTFAFSIGVEPSVAIQLDDAPVAFQARAFSDLSDVERIEVLRGPQSTLYGKAASAGLINIVTRGPTPELSGNINASATSDEERQVGGSIAGPIGEQFGFRLSANYDDWDGNTRNVFNGKEAAGREFLSVRGKLVFKPTETFTATLGAAFVDGSTTVGRPFIKLAPNAFLRGNPALPPSVWAPGITAGPKNQKFANNYPARTDYLDNAQSLKMEWDLGGPMLVAVTGHDLYKVMDALDVDESLAATLDNRQGGEFKSEQFTQEVRLVSPGDGPLRYTVGVFYADVDYTRDFVRGPAYSQANWHATAGSKQSAAFGQLDWEFLPGTTATGGVRYQHEKIDYTFRDFQNGNAFFSGDATDNFWTWRAGLNHKFTEDLMGYVSFSTGHKGQAYDLTTGFNSNRALAGPVEPETSESWEGGVRAQFLERRMTVNFTIFDSRYKNFQAQGIETLPDGTNNFRLTNVGRIHTKGAEVDSSWRVSDSLRLGASAAYVDATITEYPFAQCYPLQTAALGCTGAPARQNLKGRRPAQAPEWKLAADFDFQHPLADTGLLVIAQGAYSYQSKINYGLNQDPSTIQKGYGIANLSAGIRDPERHYEIVAFVNNLFDEQYYTNIFNQTGTYNSQPAVQVLLPRDFERFAGVRASYSF